jgi:hypothetical protein
MTDLKFSREDAKSRRQNPIASVLRDLAPSRENSTYPHIAIEVSSRKLSTSPPAAASTESTWESLATTRHWQTR